ncbi:hypothetical protein [Streptomyces sp. 6-11-2]|uniref:hypothetical protein n=1 Tax=Streptomyces sp. 6-11-2 TaxID=2585753 RepID=UPI0011413742|nr:hypothetical protein [Streptomyces sp. 6-11-2]GED90144.1 hypothetical protein TNCT6_72290 [Streptomyces sp. 6-11-2]
MVTEAERKKSKDPRRRPRREAAATPPVLRKMVAATTTTAIGRRDLAVLLLGFALAARRSELRLLDWTDLEEVEEGLAIIGDAVTRAAARAGLTAPTKVLSDLPPCWSGHSLRRGFPTAAKQAGADLIETGRHGGWVDGSKSLAGYFEQAGMWDETNTLYGIGL